jgi:ectoine hydroxylase-related dioxygenase (phytanoyl-CoA dioxygenase family)
LIRRVEYVRPYKKDQSCPASAEHGKFGGQTGADPERIEAAMARFELVYCEMEPGTALFFHSNVLHCSSPNTSPNPRWSLICCYNAARNDPYKESQHPRYTLLSKVPDDAILQAGNKLLTGNTSFLDRRPPASPSR